MAIKSVVAESDLGIYMDYGGIEPNKLNPILPAINSVALATVPTLTGNVNNRNEFVIDINGESWYIDYAGDGLKLGYLSTPNISISTNTTLLNSHRNIRATAGLTLTLPLLSTITHGEEISFINDSLSNCTIVTTGGELFVDVTTFDVYPYEAITFYNGDTKYLIR